MTTYYPLPVIAEYSDERLRSDQPVFSREIADLFLTIPAEYRQAAEIEASRRTSRPVVRHRSFDRESMMEIEKFGDIHEVRKTVVAEVREQLGLEA